MFLLPNCGVLNPDFTNRMVEEPLQNPSANQHVAVLPRDEAVRLERHGWPKIRTECNPERQTLEQAFEDGEKRARGEAEGLSEIGTHGTGPGDSSRNAAWEMRNRPRLKRRMDRCSEDPEKRKRRSEKKRRK